MPLTAQKNETFVGRIRRDETQANTLNCWIVSDNLRKGAATNAVQIAEYLVANNPLVINEIDFVLTSFLLINYISAQQTIAVHFLYAPNQQRDLR